MPEIPHSHRGWLTCLFASILGGMLLVTIRASLVRSVLDNGHLMRDVWFQATLADAYFGFLAFYVWVAYRERSWIGRVVWFIAIMLLGNIAMSVYALLAIRAMKKEPGVATE